MKYYAVERTGPYLAHHGILGQKWGIRRFQNKDGSLTSEGKKRYNTGEGDNDKHKLWPGDRKMLMNMARKNELYDKRFLKRISDSYVRNAPGKDVRLKEYEKYLANPKLYNPPEIREKNALRAYRSLYKAYNAGEHVDNIKKMIKSNRPNDEIKRYSDEAARKEYKKTGSKPLRDLDKAHCEYEKSSKKYDIDRLSDIYTGQAEALINGLDHRKGLYD